MRRRGFSLIELILAIALGTIILLTVFATFRTVSTSISVANKLSRENALMRNGMLAALEEVDFWVSYDDPDGDPGAAYNGQGLRQTVANPGPGNNGYQGTGFNRLGMPFTPFTAMSGLTDLDGTVAPFDRVAASGDAARGWNPDLHWGAADERMWFQGNVAQRAQRSDQRFGRYGMITNLRSSAVLGDPNGICVRNETHHNTPCFFPGWPMPETSADYGAVTPLHTWRENQLRGLLACLGKAGLMEYTPANTLFGTYGARVLSDRQPGRDTVDEAMVNLMHGPYDFATMPFHATRDSAVAIFPRSVYASSIDRTRWRMEWGGDFNVEGRGPGDWRDWDRDHETNDLVSDTVMARWHQVEFGQVGLFAWNRDGSGYYAGITRDRTNAFLGTATVVKPLMERKPSHWPDISLAVTRYHAAGHLVNTCTVRWANLQTGQVASVTFNAIGTTLRGARQQRHRVSGWARWDSPTSRDPNLDDQ
jgi:prepilin-type N-terminal cleavage/methylation domain-containing protein